MLALLYFFFLGNTSLIAFPVRMVVTDDSFQPGNIGGTLNPALVGLGVTRGVVPARGSSLGLGVTRGVVLARGSSPSFFLSCLFFLLFFLFA